jgi:transposase
MPPKQLKRKPLPPERISRGIQDKFFREHSFFNPADSAQVKYEMLRRVGVEGEPVAATAKAFGFSRVSFYSIRMRFQKEGLAGLFGKPRGPKGGHKLKGRALELLREMSHGERDPVVLSAALGEATGVVVHPRTVRRAIALPKKKLGPSSRRGTRRS